MAPLYCTPADIRENVSGTDAGTGTCAMLTDAQLNEAIGNASNKVSAYVGTDYETDAATPVVVIPPLVVTLTIQIATFYATLTYRKGKDLSQWDPVYLGYLDATKTLADIAAGRIQVAPTPPGDPVSVGGHVRNTIPTIFTGDDSGTMADGRGGIQPAGAGGSLLRDGWYR
jgi:phage gp36-like protein